jgi:predicted SAM-dependent methyltransferase
MFELISWLGRHFLKKKSKIRPEKHSDPLILDIGENSNSPEGWTHVNFYSINFKFWKRKANKQKPDIFTDLRYPLQCPDNVVDGIYSGHTLEHLYPNHAYKLLEEMFRILKPKSWLRINVPDLKIMVDFYNGKHSIPYYTYKAEGIGNLTQNWGHHSVWDEELLSSALKMTGFVNVRKVEFGIEGTDKRLIKEKEVRKHETLVMEAQKP